MNASMIKGIAVGTVVATAGGAVAGYNMLERPDPALPQFAEVIITVPATERIEVSREVCQDVEVTQKAEPRDKHRVIGTATGAIIGGVLGNQVGGGSGKTVATVVGAAAGGYAGNKVQQRVQSDDTVTATETRCDTVVDYEDKVVGYDVTYVIDDREAQIRLSSDPGDRIPLVNGELSPEIEATVVRSS